MSGAAGDNPFDLDPDSRELWWLTRDDIHDLLDLIDLYADVRRTQLFACACARLAEAKFPGPSCREVVRVAEEYADGAVPLADLLAAARPAVAEIDSAHDRHASDNDRYVRRAGEAVRYAAVLGGSPSVDRLIRVAANATHAADGHYAGPAHDALAPLLRCIFGNPFRPVRFRPGWRTEAAVALARQMYDARDFGPMPVLADALDDAGCTNAGILDHCRGPGPHARGCWVVDGLLGKA